VNVSRFKHPEWSAFWRVVAYLMLAGIILILIDQTFRVRESVDASTESRTILCSLALVELHENRDAEVIDVKRLTGVVARACATTHP